jgi:N-acetylglutamate synthase-like GNAT family acetyltransferase
MIEIKRLEKKEWGILNSVDDGFSPHPENSIAIVAFNEHGDIIGRIFLVAPAHLEGIFVDHPWRNRMVMGQLVERAEKEAMDAGITKVFAYAVNEQMEDYITRLGYKKSDLVVYFKDLGGDSCQPR